MNKTTAKRAASAAKPSRTAAKSAKVTPAKRTPARPTSKAAPARKRAPARPASKSVAGKPVARGAAKPAGKTVARVAPRAAPAKKSAPARAPVARPSAKPAGKTPNKIAPVTQTPVPKAPAAKAVAAPKASARPAGRGVSKPGPAVAASLPPAPLSGASRFADRFAPARPPARPTILPAAETRAHIKVDPKLANAWKSKTGRELSEEELLAMPDAEYMNDKQLEFFRVRLQALNDDLLSNAGETTEHLREDTSIVPDPADRATIEEEHALELRTRDRERKLLKKISQSLARIDAGDYGFCDETGEPIGLGRLIARPTATLSLEAQQRRELKQKMFGD